MKFNVITVFPDLVASSLSQGVVGQAIAHNQVGLNLVNPRDFTNDKYGSVDDRPFGGGDGMVMTIDPLLEALKSLGDGLGHVALLSPQGALWNDRRARDWAKRTTPITLICGRYAGIDQRLINAFVKEEISIGDYVLSGGELAASVVIDSTVRFLPGVLGNELSPDNESFATDVFEGPLFTRPRTHALGDVPEVFLSGNHAQIEVMRKSLSRVLTKLRRPQMLSKHDHDKLKGDLSELSHLDEGQLKSLGLSGEELHRLAETL